MQDVVQTLEPHAQKAYHGDFSSLPDKSAATVHTAGMLWLVKNSGFLKGGWVGGGSWFGPS